MRFFRELLIEQRLKSKVLKIKEHKQSLCKFSVVGSPIRKTRTFYSYTVSLGKFKNLYLAKQFKNKQLNKYHSISIYGGIRFKRQKTVYLKYGGDNELE
jgi:hypothetical protein